MRNAQDEVQSAFLCSSDTMIPWSHDFNFLSLSPTSHERSRTERPQEDTKAAGPEAPAAIPAEWGEGRGVRLEEAAPLRSYQL